MKKTFYYTVTKETESIGDNDGFEETTGNKNISVYDIVDNVPKKILDIDVENSVNSVEEIKDSLDEDEFGTEFDLVLL